jgi:hypothetical protein
LLGGKVGDDCNPLYQAAYRIDSTADINRNERELAVLDSLLTLCDPNTEISKYTDGARFATKLTPLHLFAERSSPEALKRLIEKGANKDAEATVIYYNEEPYSKVLFQQVTPLHLAIQACQNPLSQCEKSVEMLAKLGADLNAEARSLDLGAHEELMLGHWYYLMTPSQNDIEKRSLYYEISKENSTLKISWQSEEVGEKIHTANGELLFSNDWWYYAKLTTPEGSFFGIMELRYMGDFELRTRFKKTEDEDWDNDIIAFKNGAIMERVAGQVVCKAPEGERKWKVGDLKGCRTDCLNTPTCYYVIWEQSNGSCQQFAMNECPQHFHGPELPRQAYDAATALIKNTMVMRLPRVLQKRDFQYGQAANFTNHVSSLRPLDIARKLKCTKCEEILLGNKAFPAKSLPASLTGWSPHSNTCNFDIQYYYHDMHGKY